MNARAADGCIKCGACLRACPVLAQEGKEEFPGPRRLVVEAPRFNVPLASLRPPLALCTTCARCEEACPSRLPLTDAMVRMKASIDWGTDRPEGQARMLDSVSRTGRAVAPDRPSPPAPSEGDIMFFPGCIAEGRLPEVVGASLALLKAAGERPYVPSGWACCGSPLEKVGASWHLSSVRAANAPILRGKAVTACPGCTVQLRNAYGMEALHVIEHLHSRGGIPARRYLRDAPLVTVALHRPCHLARVVGPHTMEMARDLLGSVPGVTVTEYDEQDGCCGGGGGVASSRPEVAERMARGKIRSARSAGADVLLAPCPFCVINLRRAGGMAVEDLMVFLARRLEVGENK
ncbi:MAG: 4Fe-4S dicluster domain-containing protein [Methanomassiliicoccus sp.]|nr:4Fe-4S dicluster domain-containing protein [Methanomassiliicoccus sp.]